MACLTSEFSLLWFYLCHCGYQLILCPEIFLQALSLPLLWPFWQALHLLKLFQCLYRILFAGIFGHMKYSDMGSKWHPRWVPDALWFHSFCFMASFICCQGGGLQMREVTRSQERPGTGWNVRNTEVLQEIKHMLESGLARQKNYSCVEGCALRGNRVRKHL